MSDPVRWSEGGDASELERELLQAAQSRRLPDSERRALWAGIALSLPAQPGPLPVPPPGAAASQLGAYLTKGKLFLAMLAGLGLGAVGLSVWSSSSAPPTTVATVPSSPALPAATPPVIEAPAIVQEPVVAEEPSKAALEAKPRVSAASQLREESAAVLEARAALRAGDAPRSLALLSQARARFPRGALGQEREALTIEALSRAGQAAAAQRRAKAFLAAHPQSPYVADLRRIAGD